MGEEVNAEEFQKDSWFELHLPHELVCMELLLCIFHRYSEQVRVVVGRERVFLSEAKDLLFEPILEEFR